MATKGYRFHYSADGKTLEFEGDRAFVLAMIKRFEPSGAQQSLGQIERKAARQHDAAKNAESSKAVSVREFIQRMELKKSTDIALAFGYFLEKHRGHTDFSAADVNNCYYEAKLESSNTSQMIANNIHTGRIMEAKKKGEAKGRLRYTLTATGEKFIKERLESRSKE